MAHTTVTTDNTEEAATLAACIAKFGPNVVDDLVTNWIKGHGDSFRREDVENILTASAIDPAVKSAADTLAVQAKAAIAAKAAADKDDPTDATGVIS